PSATITTSATGRTVTSVASNSTPPKQDGRPATLRKPRSKSAAASVGPSTMKSGPVSSVSAQAGKNNPSWLPFTAYLKPSDDRRRIPVIVRKVSIIGNVQQPGPRHRVPIAAKALAHAHPTESADRESTDIPNEVAKICNRPDLATSWHRSANGKRPV